jgi:hypothetical protein
MIHTFETTEENALRNGKDPTTKSCISQNIERSTVVRMYNKGMGGTDSFDQSLSYYRPTDND